MKKHLRKEIKARLLAMTPQEARARSRAACESMIAQKEFAQACTTMIYLSIPGEVDTADLALAAWRAGKTVLAPKVSWEHRHLVPMEIRSLETGVVAGSYGVREPAEGHPWPLEDIDLIVVPALAYDRRGNRLGRGAGFYDRFLAHPQVRAFKCGLAFQDQVLEELPVQDHDFPVQMLVTDREVLRFT